MNSIVPDSSCYPQTGLVSRCSTPVYWQVWKDAIDLSQGHQFLGGAVKCCFHYTSERGFRNITNAKKEAVEIFVSG